MLQAPLYPNHNNLLRRLSCLKLLIPLSHILFGWSHLNTWYYGGRWAANCHPDDLWSSYFTSSKHVKAFREQNGEPDVIEVRQQFENKEQTREWEHKVLRRMKVVRNERWLNKTHSLMPSFFGCNHSENSKNQIRKKLKGKSQSNESNEKRSISLSGRVGLPCSPQTKHLISLSEKGKILSQATKDLISLSNKLREKKICSFCHQSFDPMNYKRWHGENCKLFQPSSIRELKRVSQQNL